MLDTIYLKICKIACQNRIWSIRIELLVKMIVERAVIFQGAFPLWLFSGTFRKVHRIHQFLSMVPSASAVLITLREYLDSTDYMKK